MDSSAVSGTQSLPVSSTPHRYQSVNVFPNREAAALQKSKQIMYKLSKVKNAFNTKRRTMGLSASASHLLLQ